MAHEPGPMHMGRGRGRSREMMGRGGAVNRMVVDHRPRALAILGGHSAGEGGADAALCGESPSALFKESEQLVS